MHFDEYTWQNEIIKEEERPAEKSETVSCPNCGYENPKGTAVCKQCGMKFTLFGMNVVDALHEEEKKAANSNRSIPDYKAPFSLGTGIGFDKKDETEIPAAAKEVEELLTSVLSGNNEGNKGGRLNLGGPFPESDEIGGVLTNNIGNFVGSNGMAYISKFKKMERGSKLSFNFGAFFFSPYWFFYRKLYKAGIVLMTVSLSLSIIATPYLYEIMDLVEKYEPLLSAGTMTEAQFTEFYTAFTAASAPMMLFGAAIFLIQLICGFIANPIYKKYVIEHAGKAERSENKNEAMRYIIRNGGASLIIGGASYFAYQLLSMLVSSLL